MPKLSPQEELEELYEIQGRIDAVAKDLSSGRNRYAKIETWELGELLGLDLDDTAGWSKLYLALIRSVEDEGFEHPVAENIELLEGLIPADRFEILKERAEKCMKADKADMRIRKKERTLLNEAYTRRRADGWSNIVVASKYLESSDGDMLTFEVEIGDGGDAFGGHSPYVVATGRGFDYANYVEVGDSW